jgi:hypothetical protein
LEDCFASLAMTVDVLKLCNLQPTYAEASVGKACNLK